MWAIPKIAFRHILLHRRRSVLTGLAVFIPSFLLFFSASAMNGIERQVLKKYVNLQTGEVVVVWESLKKVNNTDPTRFINTTQTNSFDVAKNRQNRMAMARLREYLDEHREEIRAFFPTIRRNARLVSGRDLDSLFLVYALTPESSAFLLETKTLEMVEGSLLAATDHTVCISQEKAEQHGLQLGDCLTIEATTPYGAKNSMDFIVGGIYANGAAYDNWYGFVAEQEARGLLDYDPGYFDLARIYLKNRAHTRRFAQALDRHLLAGGRGLRAESYDEASVAYMNNAQSIRSIFFVFMVFLLIVIAIGLRSTVRLGLFERMREFGTIRAVGYGNGQSFVLVFMELFFLALIVLAVAFILTGILVAILGRTGVYIGSGPNTYFFGGESFYPEIRIGDLVDAFLVILLFSLVSTLGPGLELSFQKIPDLLAKRPRPIHWWKVIARSARRQMPRQSDHRASGQGLRGS
ncbi:MAG: FtsX-like permease family protein [Firmicutes bacterium]|nr:FtsX-like permease family protein [Bacillota bacterium]